MRATQIIIIVCLLFQLTHATWNLYEEEFKGMFNEQDVKGWTTNKELEGIVNSCAKDQYVGGYGKFSQKTELVKMYEDLPPHTKITVSFTLWQFDPIDSTQDWDLSQFKMQLDDIDLYNDFDTESIAIGDGACGTDMGLVRQKKITYVQDHNDKMMKLKFYDLLTHPSTQTSWGISDLQIYIFCKGYVVGDLCLSADQYTKCADQLIEISDKLDGTAESIQIEKGQAYKINLKYQGDYKHDDECFKQRVKVEGKELNIGEGVNLFKFNEKDQSVDIEIGHKDLEVLYGCQKITDNEQFMWLCDIDLGIYLGGIKQVQFDYQLQISQKRNQDSKFMTSVVENLSEKDCCKNQLNIETTLKFCTSFECRQYLPMPLAVKKNTEIFVEHAISTPEYQNYYLQAVSLKLGAYIPEIIKQNEQEMGRVIYRLKPNMAMNTIEVLAISRISLNPGSARFLQEDTTNNNNNGGNEESDKMIKDEDDYKLKGVATLTISQDQKVIKQNIVDNTVEEDSGSNGLKIAILISLIIVIVILAILLRIYIKRRNTKNIEECYKEEGQANNNNGNNNNQQQFNDQQGSNLEIRPGGQISMDESKLDDNADKSINPMVNRRDFMMENNLRDQNLRSKNDSLDILRASSQLPSDRP